MADLDPDLPITDLRPMDDVVADSLSRMTFTMWLLLLSAGIALFLGSVGIYGVVSYVATQRTSEMGLRLALGAGTGTVRGIIVRYGLLITGAGIALGIAGAAALGRVLDTLLYEVEA